VLRLNAHPLSSFYLITTFCGLHVYMLKLVYCPTQYQLEKLYHWSGYELENWGLIPCRDNNFCVYAGTGSQLAYYATDMKGASLETKQLQHETSWSLMNACNVPSILPCHHGTILQHMKKFSISYCLRLMLIICVSTVNSAHTLQWMCILLLVLMW